MEPPHFFSSFLSRDGRETRRVRSAAIRFRSNAPRGFTLIEMLVVLAIIVVITAITVVGQANFNKSMLLTDTAYTIALSIRESESFGLSSRLFSGVPNAGYGIHFTITSPATETSYVQFADITQTAQLPVASGCPVGTAGYPDYKPGNCLYDGASELVQTYTLGQGYYISNLCGIKTNGVEMCSTSYPGSTDSIDVAFTRPETDGVITAILNGSEVPLTEAIVHVVAPSGGERCVVVSQLGQVYVTATCP